MKKLIHLNFTSAVWLFFAWLITSVADFVLNLDVLLSYYANLRTQIYDLESSVIQPWLPAIIILSFFAIEYFAWYWYFRPDEPGAGPFAFVIGCLLIGIGTLAYRGGPFELDWQVLPDIISPSSLLIYVGLSHLAYSFIPATTMKIGLAREEIKRLRYQATVREQISGIGPKRQLKDKYSRAPQEISLPAHLQKNLQKQRKKQPKLRLDGKDKGKENNILPRTSPRPPYKSEKNEELVLPTSLNASSPRKFSFH